MFFIKKGMNSSSWICTSFTCYFLLKTMTPAQRQHETLILMTCFHSTWSYDPLFKPKRHEPSSLSLFLESRDSDSVQPIYWVRHRLWAGSSNLASAFTKTDASRPRGLLHDGWMQLPPLKLRHPTTGQWFGAAPPSSCQPIISSHAAILAEQLQICHLFYCWLPNHPTVFNVWSY